jgi:segregation and condensation protein A
VTAVAVRELPLDLDTFEGPFDLLLTLVLKHELPLSDVEIAGIVLAFLEDLSAEEAEARYTTEQIEACGEFLVLVAALLELKVRELLDEQGELDVEEIDPEAAAAELAERLAAYRRAKAGAGWLASRLDEQAARFFRIGPAPLAPTPPRQLSPQEPGALAAAMRALAAEPPTPSLAHLALELPSVERFADSFRAIVRRQRQFSFDDEVEGLSRLEVAVALVALLDLHRAGTVAIEQPAPFAPITVRAQG